MNTVTISHVLVSELYNISLVIHKIIFLLFFFVLKTEIASILKLLKHSKHFGALKATTHARKLLGHCLTKIWSVPISILADQFPGIAWQIEGSRIHSQKTVHMQIFCLGDKNV